MAFVNGLPAHSVRICCDIYENMCQVKKRIESFMGEQNNNHFHKSLANMSPAEFLSLTTSEVDRFGTA